MGIQRRHRSCTNPVPARFGDHCYGVNLDDRLCIPGPCAGPSVAFRSTNLTNLTPTSGETLVFTTAPLNDGNGYNISTGVFTAPIAGTYIFSLQLCVPAGKNTYYAIMVGTEEVKRGRFIDNDFHTCYSSDTFVVLKSNENVYVKSIYQSYLATNDYLWNTFSGILVHT
ncbi:collagen alpha-2(VIII) chain-like [Mercenaria mercenaria]|uniref:collagen alpha-2(VIII) chain-like n=1 Tax=Mercenaria mercenaria TaxID=6596 RepID=UPI00234E8417|nr:collagen alpha-2(VIII) chain-like [Mercenaria mercenaria]